MYNPAVTVRRIDVLIRILSGRKAILSANCVRAYSSEGKVTIGDVSKDIKTPKKIEYVPRKYLAVENSELKYLSQSSLRNLRWMMQKDSLGQDMFLLGRPGPSRRKVALEYLELTQRELEYVALSRDTTEADLKQRREIQQSTAKYFDQSAVRAAVEGRVLVLEGIEKAERNVLPVLNNLLENREMHLEDGRFLVPAARYDKLLKEHGEEELSKWRLVRVDENFRVIALGLPVPRYSGQPLDPPLRSRFQARDVVTIGFREHLNTLKDEAPRVDQVKLEQLLSAAYALISPELQQVSLPDFPVDSLQAAARILDTSSETAVSDILDTPYSRTGGRASSVSSVSSCNENSESRRTPRETYYIPGLKYNNKYRPAKGKLIDRYNNQRRLLKREGVLGRKRKLEIENIDHEHLDIEEDEATVIWLQYNKEPFDEVKKKWLQTRKYRIETDYKNSKHHLQDILKKYPLLKQSFGFQLIELDFEYIHPKRDISLFVKFPQFLEKANDAFSDVKVFQDLKILFNNTTKEDTKAFIALSLLCGKLVPTVGRSTADRRKDKDEKRSSKDSVEKTKYNKPTILESRDSLILHVKENNPSIPIHKLIYLLYPYKTFLTKEHIRNAEAVLLNLNIETSPRWSISLQGVEFTEKEALLTMEINGDKSQFAVQCGERKKGREERRIVKTDFQSELLNELLLSHSVGDFCIVGPKGCGKSLLVTQLASLLGYTIEPIVLYQDMTARDLVQQRTTLDNGDTVWRNSALVDAALKGHLAVLDGLHRIHASTLSVLHRLVHDRELQLHDGKRLLRHDRYDDLVASGVTPQELEESGVMRIHSAFRIVALAEPPTLGRGPHWLSPEILSLFIFHEMRNLSKNEEIFIINSLFGDISQPLHSIINLADELRKSDDSTLHSLSSSLSTRQLLRIASRMASYPTDSAYETVQRTFLAKFLPNLARRALDGACIRIGIDPPRKFGLFGGTEKKISCSVKDGVVTIGNTCTEVFKTNALTKVPDILFYDVPQHVRLLEWLLQDFLLGNHLLLVGNQGVGKNKIADRLLQLLNRPREYIQLHRDTTVQSLTVQPTVQDGIVVYEDSPLVKAVKHGHVLVVDEADKAPTHVTCILKTLVENGEMILSDGRRIVPKDMMESSGGDAASFIPVHDDFRMIVLANRPGFPFLGNDFFAALGDLFSCHAVDNPSVESELELLRSYGPDVPHDVMNKLVQAFAVLRNMADQGQLTYPYSTRELVNIVRHLQKYPSEDLASAISNVFDFDRYSKEMADTLLEVLHASGLPTEGVLEGRSKDALKKLQMTIERTSGKDTTSPKHGKEDPDNKPHVGGNTWAGGTGGRDTAGLGGKGGPYRLDKGHDVHQLSEAEKDDVPEHVKQAAREMNRKAFEERLKEINISEYDAKLYEQFYKAVQPQIGALRGVLAELQAKKKERQWSRHQTSGELDDGKIIEGLTGERAIYRRRAEQEPPPGAPPHQPKRLRLVCDVSGSMYRFNSYDGRLERSMEAVVLLTEAMKGYETRIRYDIYAHSGEEKALELVRVDRPPENEKQRLQIIRTMHAHAQFCWSGDNTLPGAQHAITTLAQEHNEEDSVVLILSDANLRRYGIPPEHLGAILMSEPKVQAHVIFIGSLGDEANSLLRKLPVGHGHVCMDVASLPHIMQQIFAASLLDNTTD